MKLKALVVDDHKLLAETLSSSLMATDNFEIINVCHNSKDALWDIQVHHPDVLLLDINMPFAGNDLPRASGFDVLEEIQKKNTQPK